MHGLTQHTDGVMVMCSGGVGGDGGVIVGDVGGEVVVVMLVVR